MKYGYARCSTSEEKQDIDRQIRELKAAGADEVVFEYEHGDTKLKKNLSMLLDTVQEGDTSVLISHNMYTLHRSQNTAHQEQEPHLSATPQYTACRRAQSRNAPESTAL